MYYAWLLNAPFPLTPALSLGERGTCIPLLEERGAADWRKAGKRFSLSRGERAGVRGNETFNNPP